MVIDLRNQKRTIKIEIEAEGYLFNLDDYVDELVENLEKIYRIEKREERIKMKITLE